MSQSQSTGEPIVNMLFEYDVHFDYNNGDPVFSVWQNGVKVSNNIVIESHAATLIFRLQTSGISAGNSAVYATHFQWLDDKRDPATRPTNIAFIRDDDTRVTLLDSNPNTAEGEIDYYHFVFVVLYRYTDEKGDKHVKMYSSKDPVIINKKPPA